MLELKLGKTNIKVNRIGMGGIPIQKLKASESDKLLKKAVELGINFYDTARIYTDSEIKLGRILSKNRDKVFIATKTYARRGDAIEKDLDTSLRNLKTDYIDFYLCHNISSENDIEEIFLKDGAIEIFLKVKDKGKIKHIGFSAHKPWVAIKLINKFDFELIQIPFNIVETSSSEELIPLARKKQIAIIGMKPLAGGMIKSVLLHFRWILTNGIDVIIPGFDNISQINEIFTSLKEITPLNDNEFKILKDEADKLGKEFCRRCEYCMPCPNGLNISFLHLLRFYYFSYDLKQWAWERINSLSKSYKDCAACYECVSKCPYELETPVLFKQAWEQILKDRGNS
jgi:predicted aldo/keto reductase-like oxidoreductase